MKKNVKRVIACSLLASMLGVNGAVASKTVMAEGARSASAITLSSIGYMWLDAEDNGQLSWELIGGCARYEVSVRDTKTDTVVLFHKVMGKYETELNLKSEILLKEGRRYKVWVAAYDYNNKIMTESIESFVYRR